MKNLISYRFNFTTSVVLHGLILALLIWDPSSSRPVLSLEAKSEDNQSRQEIVHAVSIDSRQVAETMQRIQKERQHALDTANNQRRLLEQQAIEAKQARIKEQQKIAQLKLDAQIQLKKLAKQKLEQEQQIAEMKKKQDQLKQQHIAELARQKLIEQKAAEQKAIELAAAQKKALADKKAASEKLAAANSEKAAHMAGEVNKYKALILGAIGRQWIVPDNVNRQLSSQFRIRLAPNGSVLEVSLVRSSGDPILDRSAQSAIYKASPLPVPADSFTFQVFREIRLTVRPETARG